MPLLPASRIAAPQPAKTSTKVPRNSAPSRLARDSSIATLPERINGCRDGSCRIERVWGRRLTVNVPSLNGYLRTEWLARPQPLSAEVATQRGGVGSDGQGEQVETVSSGRTDRGS